MDASGVEVAAQAGLRRRGQQGTSTMNEKLVRGTVPPTKPASSPFAPLVDGVWYLWTYLCAMFGLVLVEPAEFVAMRTYAELIQ